MRGATSRTGRLLALGRALSSLENEPRWQARVQADPVEFPRRYSAPEDIELVGLLTAAFAYGRPVSFKASVEKILRRLGPAPARWLARASFDDIVNVARGFVYRFHRASDLAVLLLAIRAAQQRFGSLESVFLDASVKSTEGLAAVHGFSRALLALVDIDRVSVVLGVPRGLAHLLPHGPTSASKRLNLFLRWMVRGPDEIDLGVWTRVSPADLSIPLDTHVVRLSQWLGLTTRKTSSAAMVNEVTMSLRVMRPHDPIGFDFVLCHLGMSGACPPQPRAENCERCALKEHCRVGKRLTRRRA